MVVELQVVGPSYIGFTLLSNIHLQFYLEDDEEIVIVRYITSNVLEAYSLGYCLGSANWMIDCGGEKISIVSSSSTVQNIHPLPFDKTVLNNADVIIFSDLRDKDGARFETIFIEIGNCVANTLKNKGNVLFPLR
ncbi:unnamed protein product [Rhizophagus irregularis]|nr:unnamed protein product [Rhizophagus irregularis]